MKPARIAIVAALFLTACTTNPTTGRKQLNAIGRDEEIAMGIQASPDMLKQYGGKVKNEAVQQYVAEIGNKMAAVTEGENPKLPWEFTLLDSDVINAFSLPGGKVFFSKGLAVKLKNEAQMAGVLGHEIGHVTARHINDQMVHQTEVGVAGQLASVLLEGKGGAAGAQLTPMLVNLGGQSVLLRFSRGQESEADSLGMRYMTKVHYNPSGMLGVMEVLQEEMKGNTTPEILSTHPYPETRIKDIKKALSTTYAAMVNDPGYSLGAPEYQKRFLQPMGVKMSQASSPDALAFGELGSPVLWCEHCREAAVRAAAH